ncbi:MAG: hypothetical protein AB2L20_15440 [Mangrovibacterium sp.]
MKKLITLVVCLLPVYNVFAQQDVDDSPRILSSNDFQFLKGMTKDVLESARIRPGQTISPDFGPNKTGGTLIRPGGRDCYPSFWIRDYAMSLESGLITTDEQKHMIKLVASTQCDQTMITKGGCIIPLGSVADHIRIDDGLPVYFPGTYSYEDQGDSKWGTFPPYCDHFYFIHMACFYIKQSSDYECLSTEVNGFSLINRLEMAYKVPPVKMGSLIVHTTEKLRGVDFGFRDAIEITGDLCFPSILKYQASVELAYLFEKMNNNLKSAEYRNIAETLKKDIPTLFYDQRGMLLASTGKSNQPDVWSTAFAVYLGIIEGEMQKKTCQFLAEAFQSGVLAYKGNIRHILTKDDFGKMTAWEVSFVSKNTYQNGAYWGTPTGWVCYAIALFDYGIAQKLATEYIEDLRLNDFRKGEDYGAPFECFHPSGNLQNPVYLTSVTCPYAVFKSMMNPTSRY